MSKPPDLKAKWDTPDSRENMGPTGSYVFALKVSQLIALPKTAAISCSLSFGWAASGSVFTARWISLIRGSLVCLLTRSPQQSIPISTSPNECAHLKKNNFVKIYILQQSASLQNVCKRSAPGMCFGRTYLNTSAVLAHKVAINTFSAGKQEGLPILRKS